MMALQYSSTEEPTEFPPHSTWPGRLAQRHPLEQSPSSPGSRWTFSLQGPSQMSQPGLDPHLRRMLQGSGYQGHAEG